MKSWFGKNNQAFQSRRGLNVGAFEKKAMGGLYGVKITCSVDTGFIGSKLTLKLTQGFMYGDEMCLV